MSPIRSTHVIVTSSTRANLSLSVIRKLRRARPGAVCAHRRTSPIYRNAPMSRDVADGLHHLDAVTLATKKCRCRGVLFDCGEFSAWCLVWPASQGPAAEARAAYHVTGSRRCVRTAFDVGGDSVCGAQCLVWSQLHRPTLLKGDDALLRSRRSPALASSLPRTRQYGATQWIARASRSPSAWPDGGAERLHAGAYPPETLCTLIEVDDGTLRRRLLQYGL